ncbi:branched-chain amino acid ABC transporter permease [Salmonella enterica subsp. enterica]|uniref:Branched-chain amino acid ABC transporter permease n=1 Tax=Salmonella enterica I TaxID=59201 RepID=A0A379VYK6_SALET|nr:branched-chain amino acid ABC transporter permease [Salmonella enterica subsp. enterica]
MRSGRRPILADWHTDWRRCRQTAPGPRTIGLDAVFPAILLALVIPAFKNRTTLIRGCSGAALSLAAVPFVAAGLPVLLSLLGLLARKK